MSAREAAIQAVKDHPSTTFMAPYESLADAVLAAAGPLLGAEALREGETALRKKAGELSELAEEEYRRDLEERAQEWHQAANELRRMADATEQGEKDTREGESTPQPAELTIYRASHDSIVMGLYTTREAARAHCMALLLREPGDRETYGWVPDDGSELAAEELCIGYDVECTGYVVTPLTVASEYDAEADE